MPEEIVIPTRVIALGERTRIAGTKKVPTPENPNNVETIMENLGWYAQFDGSYEALFVGDKKPDTWLSKGQEVEIVIRPRRKR